MGKCSYYLVKADNFSIVGENVACPGSISESMNFGPTNDMPSCTKSVTINLFNSIKPMSIKLNQGRLVTVNGIEVAKLPVKIFDGLVTVKQASSLMILVLFKDGLQIWWDSSSRVYIDAPPNYRGQTKGLCGTFNSNVQDDFLTPEGDVESSVASFADKWRTKETCPFISDPINIPHPCQLNMENKPLALTTCTKLKEKLFDDCHWSVDPESFFEDCMYDMCACKMDISKCVCPIFAAYANECARQGVVVNWRYLVKECGMYYLKKFYLTLLFKNNKFY